MFLDPSRYPFLRSISKNAVNIRDEFFRAAVSNPDVKRAVTEEMVLDAQSERWVRDNGLYADQVGYDIRFGSHSMFAIYENGESLTGLNDCRDFDKTLALLKDIPGVRFSGFMILGPEAEVSEHAHNRSNLIYHLLLNDLSGGCCEVVCGGVRRKIRSFGDELLFDYSIPHKSFNYAENHRVNFVIDFSEV